MNRARHTFFVVTGKEKAPVLKQIIEEGDASLPGARVRCERWLLDEAAASLLSESCYTRIE